MSLTRKQSLRALDRRLTSLREALLRDQARPPQGWIRTLRQALGMSAEQLGRRLGITKQGVLRLERGEKEQQLSLASLRKVADALEADLVYAIVPRIPIQQTLIERAREIASARTRRVAHSMQLEKQGIAEVEQEHQIADYAAELLKRPRDLWK